jgi:hypothetical protein
MIALRQKSASRKTAVCPRRLRVRDALLQL